MTILAAATVKATLALLVALSAVIVCRRAAGATRHAIVLAGQLAALTVPLLAFVVPDVRVTVPPMTMRAAEVAPVAPISVAPLAHPPQLPTSSRDFVLVIWALGCGAVVAARIVSHVRAAALVARAQSFEKGVLLSEDVDQPLTFGSRIVLPPAAATWDAARLGAVLLHERAHVARRDWFSAAIADVVCAVYWFHPLAWLAARQSTITREEACDDVVLARGVTPTAYATAIVEIARAAVADHRVPALAMAARSQLETRLRTILDPSHRIRTTRGARAIVAVAAIAAAPFLAALTPRGIEPDLLGDAIASPFSEHIAVDAIPDVPATGPEAAVIARLHEFARRPRHSEIDFVADRARWALGRVQNGEVVAPLIHSLGDPDWRIRAYAAWGLAIARDRRATEALLPLLEDRIWRVRAMTASAMANIGDPAAADAMRRALDDDAWQVRTEAVQYFDQVGARPELFETMRKDRHVAVRTAAEEALQ